MTTTRIDHTGHNHPATPAARRACRTGATPAPSVASLRRERRELDRLAFADGTTPRTPADRTAFINAEVDRRVARNVADGVRFATDHANVARIRRIVTTHVNMGMI